MKRIDNRRDIFIHLTFVCINKSLTPCGMWKIYAQTSATDYSSRFSDRGGLYYCYHFIL